MSKFFNRLVGAQSEIDRLTSHILLCEKSLGYYAKRLQEEGIPLRKPQKAEPTVQDCIKEMRAGIKDMERAIADAKLEAAIHSSPTPKELLDAMCVEPKPSPEGQSEIERELKITRRAHLQATSERDYFRTLWKASRAEITALRAQSRNILTNLNDE